MANDSFDNNTYLSMMRVNETVNLTFIAMCMPFVLIGNLLVVISVARFTQLQTTMNIFVSNLALADLLVGFPTIPLYILFYVNDSVKSMKYLCLFKYMWVLISMPASAFNLLLVTIDRFIAIVYPFQYPVLMTKSRAKIMISIIWVYSIGSATMPMYGINNWTKEQEGKCDFWTVLPTAYTIVTVPVMQCISLGTTFVLYIKIFYEVKVNKKRIASFKAKSEMYQKKLKRDTRNAKVMAIVFCMFIVFWLPLFTSGVLKYTRLPPPIIEMLKQSAVSIAMSNSLLNALIYCWIRQDFRIAFRKLIGLRLSNDVKQALKNDDSSGENRSGQNGMKQLSRY